MGIQQVQAVEEAETWSEKDSICEKLEETRFGSRKGERGAVGVTGR